MNRFRYSLLIIWGLVVFPTQAAVLPPNSSASISDLWDSIWPGTYSTISVLSAGFVASTILIWMGWVIQGIYVALVVKGQIGLLEATFLFMRLCILVTAVMILLNL